MHTLRPSRPIDAEQEPAAPPRLHLLSLPSLLWTSALLLWWWALEGSDLVAGVLTLIDDGGAGQRPLVLGGLAALGVIVVALVHFVVAACAEVLRWLWHAATRWLGLDG